MENVAPLLSVVVPMYNEEAVLPLLIERLRPALDEMDGSYEVVAVDDGSTDRTAELLGDARLLWPALRVIRLRRNCGHQAALLAGLHRAGGRYVVSIDADLQDPPEVIGELVAKAQAEDLDVVYGVRGDRDTDTRFKRGTAGAYYALMRRLAGRHVPRQAGDFRLLSRDAIDALRELPERSPVLRLVVPWLGFPSGEVRYTREERAAGKTKYPMSKMVRLAMDSVTSFSSAPLRLATWLGLTGVVVCGILTIIAFSAYIGGATVSGWASIYVVVLFLGAVQLLVLGLLGEYVGRIHTALQNRPAYYIRSDTGREHPADQLPGAGPIGGKRTS
jgi:dolichol-phosphate mannosyltransferase